MTKPTKSQKNSFIFLETIFSILILSSVVALFLNINFSKELLQHQIQTIENQFLDKAFDTHYQTKNKALIFIKNESEEYHINVKEISFNNDFIKLKQYVQ